MQQERNPRELKKKNGEEVIGLIVNLKFCRKKKKPPQRLFCGASWLKTTWWKQKAEASAVPETCRNDQLWVFSQSFHAEPPLKVVTRVQLSRPLLKRRSFPLNYDGREPKRQNLNPEEVKEKKKKKVLRERERGRMAQGRMA